MTELADLGVTGLAVMGANLARNAARKGFRVALHNRSNDRTDQLLAEHGGEGKFIATHTAAEFVAALAKPRVILIMVKAGKPIDEVIGELLPHLEAGDIITEIDGKTVTDANVGLNLIAQTQPGSKIALRGLHQGAPFDREVTVSKRPTPAAH